VAGRLASGFASVRDGLLFLVGLALIARAVIVEPLCEACLLVGVGLCIAPAALLPAVAGRFGAPLPEDPPRPEEPAA